MMKRKSRWIEVEKIILLPYFTMALFSYITNRKKFLGIKYLKYSPENKVKQTSAKPTLWISLKMNILR